MFKLEFGLILIDIITYKYIRTYRYYNLIFISISLHKCIMYYRSIINYVD